MPRQFLRGSAAVSLVGHLGVEPKTSCSQSRRAPICTSARMSVRTAGFEPTISSSPCWRDNQASPRSDCVVLSSPYGNRTHLSADQPPVGARRAVSSADRRTGRLVLLVRAYLSRSGLGGARILVCGSSDRRYAVSATSPRRGGQFPIKKPDVAVTPGFAFFAVEAKCHKRKGCGGSVFA